MNFRNRKLVITIRTILGLIFLMSGVTGLLGGPSAEGIPPPMMAATQALWSMGIFQMIKVTEIVAGLMLVAGFLPALAVIIVTPICVGVIIFNGSVAPAYLISGIIVSVLNAYLAYAYWDKYKALFERK